MSTRRTPRLAVNPIAYWMRGGRIDRSRGVLEEAFADIQRLGYRAVKADVPTDMTCDEYLAWIGSYGLAPSVSLFSSALDETVEMVSELERAKAFAAQQAALGLDRAMVSSMMISARMAAPGIAARVGMSYVETQLTKRLWTEPGDGVVDFDAVLAAMPHDYDGDYMIEVDEPSIDDRFESSRRSHAWAMRALPFLA